MCIRDICYTIYYQIIECWYSKPEPPQQRQLFIDEERGLVYYDNLLEIYNYNRSVEF